MKTRRGFFSSSLLAAAALALAWAEPARGAVPVVDGSSIAQLISQIVETQQQIETTFRQVEALQNAARQLDPSSYRSINDLLRGNEVNFMALLQDIRTMGYNVERVNDQFRRIFPDERAVRNMRARDHENTAREMNREVHSAALVAARAQTTLSTIEANNREAQAILSRSEDSDSQVAQMQSAIQMLAVVHQNLVAITQTVNSAGRVSSDIAAAAVTERRIARERRRRLLLNYGRPSRGPGIDRRFLR